MPLNTCVGGSRCTFKPMIGSFSGNCVLLHIIEIDLDDSTFTSKSRYFQKFVEKFTFYQDIPKKNKSATSHVLAHDIRKERF